MRDPNQKIVIIGMGFLATYVMPCYRELLGDKIGEQCAGVKGSVKGLEEKQRECPFPVSAGNADEVLRERRPDIIVLAVKPHQIAAMTEGTIKPYFEMLRSEGEKLPVIYSFAPNPTVNYYYDALGGDVLAVNLLPNMIDQIKGIPVAKVGVSFVAFDQRASWPEEKRQMALAFMEPTGTIVEVDPDKAIPYLAGQCACHLMFELNYAAADTLCAHGFSCDTNTTAGAYRSLFHRIFKDDCTAVIPCSDGGLPKQMLSFMDGILEAWYQGCMRFLQDENIPFDASDRMLKGTIEAYHMQAQLETREYLLEQTRNHATPGGFLEMALKTWNGRGCAYIAEQMEKALAEGPDPDYPENVQAIACEIARAVSEHGKTVSGIKQ